MFNEVTSIPPVATTNVQSSYPQWSGFICAGISILFFGIQYIPVKKYEVGDGLFYQFSMCISIWIVGLVVTAIRGIPEFHALAMLGGVMWCTASVLCVPIIKCIGLGLGMLLMSTTNLLSGWASARFGWFGIDKEVPKDISLNDVGVSLAAFSGLVFLLIKPEVNKRQIQQQDIQSVVPHDSEPVTSDVWTSRLSPPLRRLVGVVLALLAGPLLGLSFTPYIYVMDHNSNASQHGLDYVFAFACGILATSSCYFLIYCLIKRNRPDVYPQIMLPAAVSGVLWSVGSASWFVANEVLGESISFPIIATGPGLVASFCGIVLFREIKGVKNYLLFISAFSIILTGAVLCGLSK